MSQQLRGSVFLILLFLSAATPSWGAEAFSTSTSSSTADGAAVVARAASGKADSLPTERGAIEGCWISCFITHLSSETHLWEFTRGAKGKMTATLDVLETRQQVKFDFVSARGSSATIKLFGLRPYLEVTVSDEERLASGRIHLQTGPRPIRLVRLEKRPDLRRPQQPVGPFPYREEEVTIDRTAAGVRLAGSLMIPAGDGPHPAVFLASGSGPDDRNGFAAGHDYYLVLADALARRGVAVLRMDDRGVGKSTGDFSTVTVQESSLDAEACFDFLLKRSEVDRQRIFLLGHSDGAQAAALVAGRRKELAGLVMVGGQGVSGDELALTQYEAGCRALGENEKLVEFSLELQRKVMEIVRQELDDARATAAIQKFGEEHFAQLTDEDRAAMGVDGAYRFLGLASSPAWFRALLANDPAAALRKVKCPVLAIGGEKDLIVSSQANLPTIAAALKAGGNTEVTVRELPGLNHMLQTCKVGAPWEYVRLDETMSPAALELIGDWILRKEIVER